MSYAPGPPAGEVFLDARGHGRALRLTWHRDADLVVLSLWRDDVCAGTFRLGSKDVNDFVDALVDGLRDAPGVSRRQPEQSVPPQRTESSPAEAAMPVTGQVAIPPQLANDAPSHQSFTDWAFGDDDRADAS